MSCSSWLQPLVKGDTTKHDRARVTVKIICFTKFKQIKNSTKVLVTLNKYNQHDLKYWAIASRRSWRCVCVVGGWTRNNALGLLYCIRQPFVESLRCKYHQHRRYYRHHPKDQVRQSLHICCLKQNIHVWFQLNSKSIHNHIDTYPLFDVFFFRKAWYLW